MARFAITGLEALPTCAAGFCAYEIGKAFQAQGGIPFTAWSQCNVILAATALCGESGSTLRKIVWRQESASDTLGQLFHRNVRDLMYGLGFASLAMGCSYGENALAISGGLLCLSGLTAAAIRACVFEPEN